MPMPMKPRYDRLAVRILLERLKKMPKRFDVIHAKMRRYMGKK